jgi:hypothetical protein
MSGILLQGPYEDFKHLTRMNVGIVKNPMGHQVATIGTFPKIGVQTAAHPGPGQKRDGGRESGKKLKIDGSIQPFAPDGQ